MQTSVMSSAPAPDPALRLRHDEILALARNNFKASFLPQDQKNTWLERLETQYRS